MGQDNNLKNFSNSIFKNLESADNYKIEKDALVNKYANTISPVPHIKKTRSTLLPYTGAWTQKTAIHLLNRTMFGAKPSDAAAISGMTMSNAVDALLNAVPNPYPVGINWYQNTYTDISTPPIAFMQPWINADYGDGTQNYYRKMGLKGMWLKNIMTQNLSIHEKMVMFLYSLVPVQFDNVDDARFLYQYMQLLHQHATGNYKDFIRDITKSGAMLYYLNGYVNNKFSPDENYARELQELFTVGKYGGQQFAETDVREVAKALTGWRIDDVNITSFFDVNFHNTGNKTFGPFYNNTVITGQSGPTAGDTELNDVLNMIFSGQSATTTAQYICRKLYRFFVYYDIDAATETNIIIPLANTFIASNWNLLPVISQLFKSEHFYDNASQGCYIKTPLDIVCGLPRIMSVPIDPATTFEDEYWLYVRQVYYLEEMGYGVGEVPNVSGYKPFYQSPQWHELFINSNTFPKRLKWTDATLTSYGHYVNGTTSYKADLPLFASTLSNPGDPDILINDIVAHCFGLPISQLRKNQFKAILLSNQTNNSYWTTAWNDYMSNPTDPGYLWTVTSRLRLMLTAMFQVAENHLC
jgi:uncharacterized protein (DUF1800 family)